MFQAGALLHFPSKPQHIVVETKEVIQDTFPSLEDIKPHQVTRCASHFFRNKNFSGNRMVANLKLSLSE